MLLIHRLLKIGSSLTIAAAAYFAYPFLVPIENPTFGSFDWGFERFRLVVTGAFLGRLLLELTPTSWITRFRNLILIALLILLVADTSHWYFAVLPLVNILLLTILLLILPLHLKSFRAPAVIFGTLLIPGLLYLVVLPFQVPNFLNFLLLAPVLSFILIACSFSEFNNGKPTAAVICAMCTNFIGRGPIPIEECIEIKMEKSVFYRGLIYLGMGLLFLFIHSHLLFIPKNLNYALSNFSITNLLHLPGLAISTWFTIFLRYSSMLLLNCGVLMVLGLPVSAPITNPWLASNLLEYWQRANVHRSNFIRRVYLPYLLRLNSAGIYFGIVCIFLFFSFLHCWDFQMNVGTVLQWLLEGLLVATSMFLVRRKKRRLQTKAEPLDLKKSEKTWIQNYLPRSIWHLICILFILALKGILIMLPRLHFRFF